MNKNLIGVIIGVIIIGVATMFLVSGMTSSENVPVNEIDANNQTSSELASEGKKITISLHDGITATSP